MTQEILVIKHGALGDVVLATGPFQAIRKHHAGDRITLLTTKAFAELLRGSPYFDEVWIDPKPKLHHLSAFMGLLGKIRKVGFTRVYDMQTSERTSWYFRLLKPKPEWVGTAKGASHRHDTPQRTRMHTVERQKEQLAIAGINELPTPDVSWLTSDIGRFGLNEPYALLVPGGSAHRPGKRWPASHYATFAAWLKLQNLRPVLIGTQAEAAVLTAIETMCAGVLNLQGNTSFADIATLARGAKCAVGNDTGPMHLIAVAGTPSLVLFSDSSDPARAAPRGKKVAVMQKSPLAELTPEDVIKEVKKLL